MRCRQRTQGLDPADLLQMRSKAARATLEGGSAATRGTRVLVVVLKRCVSGLGIKTWEFTTRVVTPKNLGRKNPSGRFAQSLPDVRCCDLAVDRTVVLHAENC